MIERGRVPALSTRSLTFAAARAHGGNSDRFLSRHLYSFRSVSTRGDRRWRTVRGCRRNELHEEQSSLEGILSRPRRKARILLISLIFVAGNLDIRYSDNLASRRVAYARHCPQESLEKEDAGIEATDVRRARNPRPDFQRPTVLQRTFHNAPSVEQDSRTAEISRGISDSRHESN